VLKEILRKILWTSCYTSNITLKSFENLKKTNRDVEALLDSKMLSGGLPIECFSSLFSSQFNKQFEVLVYVCLIK